MISNYRKLGRVVGLSERTRLKETMRRSDKVKGGKEKVVARSGRETRAETHDHDEYDEDVANFVFIKDKMLSRLPVAIIQSWYKREGYVKSMADLIQKGLQSEPGSLEEVLNECSKAENWLREAQQLQDTLPKHAEPVLLSANIRKKEEAIDRYFL
ncbi:heat shock protein 70 family [Artemisia annua]|uniref:Heat shock protein 70 family n=1 Tax=Artemisia annua TaxID=35608 RepID=A0A2U1MSS3_ARTAN|nr:heat shock protein 70 family [Artemisia annua]